jgi:hypothetical protein
MKYNDLNFGQIEAVINKLGGMKGINNFLSGRTKIVNTNECPFNVWKTIKIGNLKNNDRLMNKLSNYFQSSNRSDNDGFRDLIQSPNFEISSEKKDIELVKVSMTELGFNLDEDIFFKDFCKRISELGLEFCPDEVAIQLRFQYQDQQVDEELEIFLNRDRPAFFTLENYYDFHNRKNFKIYFHKWNLGTNFNRFSAEKFSSFIFCKFK